MDVKDLLDSGEWGAIAALALIKQRAVAVTYGELAELPPPPPVDPWARPDWDTPTIYLACLA